MVLIKVAAREARINTMNMEQHEKESPNTYRLNALGLLLQFTTNVGDAKAQEETQLRRKNELQEYLEKTTGDDRSFENVEASMEKWLTETGTKVQRLPSDGKMQWIIQLSFSKLIVTLKK
jgi:hypothetical protein